jgi:hypothetical protein
VIDTDVPWEVLQKANTRLRIGLEGRLIDGTIVIPTVWAKGGYIEAGALATGEEANKPTPGIYDQIMQAIEDGKLKGEDGVSPDVSISKIEGGHRVTITDKNGTQVFDVMNGKDGSDASVSIVDNLGSSDPNAALSARMGGVLKTKIEDDVSALNEQLQPQIKQRVKTVNGVAPDENGNVVVEGGNGGNGEAGADGFSPIATVTQTGSGAVISITDKSGTTTAAIFNGTDGKDGYTPVKGVDYFDGAPGKDGADGKDGKDGAQGIQGEPGAKGDKGDQGEQGIQGIQGIQGETGAKGDKGDKGDTGEPGKDGANGKDGVSATHSWNGTTLTITSASGTSSANLKGEKGDKGDKGDQGIQGEKGEKGETGAAGSNGADGKDGSDGFATITETELAALTQENLAAKYADGVRVLAVSADENLVPASISQNGVVYNGCGYMNNYRLNSSGGTQEALSAVLTGFMPYTYGKTIEIAGGCNPANAGGQYIATYDSNFALIGVNYLSTLISNSGGGSVCTENNEFIHTVKTSSFGASSNTNLFKTAAYVRVCLCPCVGSRLRVRYI